MPPTRRAASLATLAVLTLAACPRKSDQPTPSADPAPQAASRPADQAASGALSLEALVPSPVPTQSLPPDMPRVAAGRFVFYEDFEKDMSRWKVEGGRGGVGWSRLRTKSCGGLYVMVLGMQDNKPFTHGATTSELVALGGIDLTATHRPQLQYDLKGLTRPYDLLSLQPEIRLAGGAWQPVGFVASSRFPTVVTYTASLVPYAGKQLELRFHGVVKDSSAPQTGLFLDDIHVVEPN